MATTCTALPDVRRPDLGTVLVNRWYVGVPERQQLAADALVAEWERTAWPDGCLARSCFASSDGDTVLTYSQWMGDDHHRRLGWSDTPGGWRRR